MNDLELVHSALMNAIFPGNAPTSRKVALEALARIKEAHSSGGADLSGVRYERLQMGNSRGFREFMLLYDASAEFSEWDEEYLMLSAQSLIHSARARSALEKEK